MEFIETDIPDVIRIKPRVFEDERGYFKETYREQRFAEEGITDRFLQDNFSKSDKGVLRGLHYQIHQPQAKLVMVSRGAVLDVAVDIRQGSPTFGQHVAYELTDTNHEMLYIPIGFAHGFEVLTDDTIFQYKCSDYYNPSGERGIAWNDPELSIDWHTEEPVVSGKDRNFKPLKEIPKADLFDYQTS